jgi:long-chain fatty acid transport protein
MKRIMRAASIKKLLAPLILAGASTSNFAVELGRIEGFGPVSRGFAGGGVAHATGAAAIILNPAELLSNKPGHEFMVQVSEIQAAIDVRNEQTHEIVHTANLGNNRGPYDLPEVAYSYRGDDWAFGAGIFAAAGFGIEYGRDSFLSTTTTGNVATGLESSGRLTALRIPIALAWQARPTLRLGAALDIVNLGLNIATLYDAKQVRMLVQQDRASGGLVTIVGALPTLAGVHLDFVNDHPIAGGLSGWGIGGRVGASWQVSSQTSLALAYEFETQLTDLRGKGRLTAVDILNNHIPVDGLGRFEDMQLPAAFVVGVSHQASTSVAVIADLRRTYWRKMLGDARFSYRAEGGLFDGQEMNALLALGFNNITSLTLGAQWSPNDRWTFRSGASHAVQQLVKDNNFSGAFPTLTRNHLVVNASYLWQSQYEFTFGCTYAWTPPVHNPGNNTASIPPIKGRNHQITPVISYRLAF